MLGNSSDIEAVAPRTDATTLLIAVADLDADEMEAIADAAERSALQIKVLPTVADCLGNTPSATDVRELQDTDLLGRRQVSTDLDARDRRVHPWSRRVGDRGRRFDRIGALPPAVPVPSVIAPDARP